MTNTDDVKIGDRVFIVSGRYKGATGVVKIPKVPRRYTGDEDDITKVVVNSGVYSGDKVGVFTWRLKSLSELKTDPNQAFKFSR
jgi:hypothetical protein